MEVDNAAGVAVVVEGVVREVDDIEVAAVAADIEDGVEIEGVVDKVIVVVAAAVVVVPLVIGVGSMCSTCLCAHSFVT